MEAKYALLDKVVESVRTGTALDASPPTPSGSAAG
jgi:hypothetical protein